MQRQKIFRLAGGGGNDSGNIAALRVCRRAGGETDGYDCLLRLWSMLQLGTGKLEVSETRFLESVRVCGAR
ncbi:MAG: hypothetical protein P8Y63_15880 [Deltaproteobacteria bacterium]